jgi:hypothetical protein
VLVLGRYEKEAFKALQRLFGGPYGAIHLHRLADSLADASRVPPWLNDRYELRDWLMSLSEEDRVELAGRMNASSEASRPR